MSWCIRKYSMRYNKAPESAESFCLRHKVKEARWHSKLKHQFLYMICRVNCRWRTNLLNVPCLLLEVVSMPSKARGDFLLVGDFFLFFLFPPIFFLRYGQVFQAISLPTTVRYSPLGWKAHWGSTGVDFSNPMTAVPLGRLRSWIPTEGASRHTRIQNCLHKNSVNSHVVLIIPSFLCRTFLYIQS